MKSEAVRMFLAGQILGFVAMAVSVTVYLQKNRKKIVALKLVCDVLWVLHHYLINSYTAVATTGIAIFREVVFYNKNKKWARSKLWLVLFMLLFTLSAVITWRDFFSLLPMCASILSTIAFWSNSITRIRFFSFVSSVCMLFYGIRYFSIATIVNEIMVEGTIIIISVSELMRKKSKINITSEIKK